MCHGCQPDLGRWARLALQGVESSQISSRSPEDAKDAIPLPRRVIFFNGAILTMADSTFFPVSALVVDTDGTILFTDDNEGALLAAGVAAERRDLNGACLLLGFIEPHVHLVFTALANGYLLDLSPNVGHTLAAVESSIKAELDNPRWKGWVAGFGYDPSRLPDDDYPDLTANILDCISSTVPIFVLSSYGHVAYVSTAAFNTFVEH